MAHGKPTQTPSSGKIDMRRVYGAQGLTEARGKRVLVDRIWPRGIRKDDLRPDLWLREIGPSGDLRRWFGHRPERWPEFQRRYREELSQPVQQRLVSQLADLATESPVTLLYGARDEEHNQAVVLRAVLLEALGKRRAVTGSDQEDGDADDREDVTG